MPELSKRELKRELLELLREDEEFRYAVIGMLGLEDTRKALSKLARAIGRLAAAHASLERRVEELAVNMSRLTETVQNLAREVGRLSETIGFGLEDVARAVVPGWLYRHEGIEVEDLVRKFFTVEGEEVEVNLYGEGSRAGRKVYVLGEAKSRIYGDDVWRFHSAVYRIAKLLKDGDVYMLMFGFYIHPTAEKAAEKLGVRLIASYMR